MAWFRPAGTSAATVLAALILVSAAAAGNGNGNANGNGNGNAKAADHAASADSQPRAPGNGAAPGQLKKDATPAPAPQSASVTTTSSTPVEAPPADAGVKPSSTTSKDTSCVAGGGPTCASAGNAKPDASKRYGNGTTAAQISTSRGGDGVTLKGPGNSQPHKVVTCGHRHAVDVHAVKHYNASACGDTPDPTPNPRPNPNPSPNPGPTTHPDDVPTPGDGPHDPSTTTSAHGRIVVRHIAWPIRDLGDPARHTHARSSKPASRVLGEVAAAIPVVHGTLPFTGFPLWAVTLLALALIAIGVALRAPGALTPVHARRRIHRRGSGAA